MKRQVSCFLTHCAHRRFTDWYCTSVNQRLVSCLHHWHHWLLWSVTLCRLRCMSRETKSSWETSDLLLHQDYIRCSTWTTPSWARTIQLLSCICIGCRCGIAEMSFAIARGILWLQRRENNALNRNCCNAVYNKSQINFAEDDIARLIMSYLKEILSIFYHTRQVAARVAKLALGFSNLHVGGREFIGG